jgi:hypothetical protein
MAGIKFVHKDDAEQVIKGTPKVPMNKSKKLSGLSDGEVLYYIDTETAYKLKIDSKIDFTKKHPLDEKYHLITIPIERV